jgi:membrane protease YdiL (CAAX protease family)
VGRSSAPRWPASASGWVQFTTVLVCVYAAIELVARALGSDRGQAGPIVGAVAVGACVVVERVLAGRPVHRSVGELGLGDPAARGLIAAATLCVLMMLVIPIYFVVTGARFQMYPGWPWLLLGMFFQGDIGEEVLFRGYAFRHIRNGRSFWSAATLAMGPFVLVHLALFVTLPGPVALASLLLAVAISFPLAHLFELGGNTIWGPALVHWIVQAGVKVIDIEVAGPALPAVWLLACATVPFLGFLWRRQDAPMLS